MYQELIETCELFISPSLETFAYILIFDEILPSVKCFHWEEIAT